MTAPLVLACESFPYEIGAVLSPVLAEGEEKPVAYCPRTLAATEQLFSQLEKEGLAIISVVTNFHNYIYGRHFTIEPDHQPLSFLFYENKGISQMASSQIQGWALKFATSILSDKNQEKNRCSDDALSHLLRPVTISSDVIPGELIILVDFLPLIVQY